MTIKTCFFDMGNVLVHFSHQRMCRNIAALVGRSEDIVKQHLLDSGLQWSIERGEITEADFHAALETRFEIRIDSDQLMHAAADIFWLNESIVPLIDELKSGGMRLVLLSNTSITHLKFIRTNFDILNDFDAFTTSYEAGALKPDQAIYLNALSKANCAPEECFYTDDIPAYVAAARTHGIHAEVYSETHHTREALRLLGVRV